MSVDPSPPQPIGPLDKPLHLEIIQDEVVFVGGRVAFSMTLQAAAETCHRLGVLMAEHHRSKVGDQGS